MLFCYQQSWDITQNVRENPQTLTLTDDRAVLMLLTFGIHTGISEKEHKVVKWINPNKNKKAAFKEASTVYLQTLFFARSSSRNRFETNSLLL